MNPVTSSLAKPAEFSILMICMGNICRSPTAHAVMRDKLAEAGLAGRVAVDSAGTHAAWHAGQSPDARSRSHAGRRGYDLSTLRARTLTDEDFERFDLLLVMDADNHASVLDRCPSGLEAKVVQFTTYASGKYAEVREVPDPYYGSPAGFELVLDLVENACDGILAYLQTTLPPAKG